MWPHSNGKLHFWCSGSNKEITKQVNEKNQEIDKSK